MPERDLCARMLDLLFKRSSGDEFHRIRQQFPINSIFFRAKVNEKFTLESGHRKLFAGLFQVTDLTLNLRHAVVARVILVAGFSTAIKPGAPEHM